jgi:adenylate cyclase
VAGLVSVRIRKSLVETMQTMRERERVIALFGQRVSPRVVDQLLTQPRGDASELRTVCILVLDIRNFTSFAEKRSPAEVVALLNTLWSFMVRAINEHHGFINKFLGDGFLAVFGAPFSEANDCQNALAAARRILREFDDFTSAGALPPIQVGMALHAGDAIVGNIGSAERKEYTVIGDVVNVAFRLEALNKDFGSRLLVSERVCQTAEVNGAKHVAPVQVRGRDETIEVYHVA